MRLTRVKAAMAAGVLALSGTVTATALAVVPASAAPSAVVVVSCGGHGMVRPGGYDIGCTANELLRTLHWQTWRGTAYGNGVLKVNACTPTCAQGKYIDYSILTVLWRPRGVARPRGAALLHAADLDLHRQAPGARPRRPDHHPRGSLAGAGTSPRRPPGYRSTTGR